MTKRKPPNGNILTDANGVYNRFDYGVHKRQFHRIKSEYAIGDRVNSRFLDPATIQSLAPGFIAILAKVVGVPTFPQQRPFDIITRAGRQLDARQVRKLLGWLERCPDAKNAAKKRARV